MAECKSTIRIGDIPNGYDMRKPSLRQLEAFKAFVETGSVSRAADVLFISQPAASKLLNHFEADIGMELIDRSSNRPVVTERGMRVYEEIDRILSGVDQIGQAIASIRAEERSQITVGVVPGFPANLLSKAAQIVRRERPNISLSFVVRSSEFLSHGVLSRKLDLALIARELDHAQVRSSIFYDRPMVLITPPDHPFAQRKTVSMSDLQDQPFIAFTPGSVTRRMTDAAMAEAGVNADIVLSATTAPNCCAMTAAGLGVCVLSPLFASDHLARLAVVSFTPQLPFHVHAVRPVEARDKRGLELVLRALETARDGLPGTA